MSVDSPSAVMPIGLPYMGGGLNPPLGSPSGPEPSSLGDTSNLADEKTCLQALAEFMKSVFKMIVDFGRSIIFSNPLVRLLQAVIYRSNVVEPKGSASVANSSGEIGQKRSTSAARLSKGGAVDAQILIPEGRGLSRKDMRKIKQNLAQKPNKKLNKKLAQKLNQLNKQNASSKVT